MISHEERNSQAKRVYGCPCGKTYLSYPALFTHVKHKHDGKAPGNLIKPETGKIRGRPKTRINAQDLEMQEIAEGAHRQIMAIMELEDIKYEEMFQISEGNKSCRDAASKFLNQFSDMQENERSALHCFLNQLREAVNSEFGDEHWENEKPDEIISVSNRLYMEHEEKQWKYPLPKQLLKQLTFYFFEWLYAHKFTNHRLMKKDAENSEE